MPELSSKLNLFMNSVIRRMTLVCWKYNSINLSQGFPAFEPPAEMKNALEKIAKDGPHQYTPTFGSPKLRRALADKYSSRLNHEINPETEIIVTCGGTEAMISVMMAVCNPKDKVIIFQPFYENYGADAILSGAEPIYVTLTPPEFNFNVEELENAFKQHPKALILNNPSNPTGKVFSRRELEIIAEFAKKYDTFVITDEVYEHIIYEPYEHIHIASLPGMYERTITTSSLSKTFCVTGWRLGYIIGPEYAIEGAKKTHDYLTIGAPAPLQEAACAGLSLNEEYFRKMRDAYTEKREYFCNGLTRIGIKHTKPQGSYFVMVDISDYLKLPRFAGWTDLQFCEWMAEEIGIGTVPGSSFFDGEVYGLIRMHFAKEKDVLDEVLNRLEKMQKLLKFPS